MVSNDEFFQRKQAAAVLKHGVLERYMTVFTAMTGSASSGGQVHFIDGYAGPGRYAPEEGEVAGSPGSPLLAAGTATRLAKIERDLRCTFIERDPAHAANLVAVLRAEWGQGGTYEVKTGEVETHLAAAIAGAGAAPLLIFLDPFGTALGYALLVDQMTRRSTTAKTEVLLNFNIDSVRRIGARLAEALVEGTGAYNARELTLRRVDNFLGGRWWRDVYLGAFDPGQAGSAGHAATLVAEQFRSMLSTASGFKSIEVPVRRRPGHVPLFLLTLFYRHDAAPYMFADAASLANRDWRRFNRQLDLAEEIARIDTSDELFPIGELITGAADRDADKVEAALHAEWTAQVAANIRALLQTHQRLPVGANVALIYGSTFGLAGEKHLRAAWDVVAAEGGVDARDKKQRLWSQTISRATR